MQTTVRWALVVAGLAVFFFLDRVAMAKASPDPAPVHGALAGHEHAPGAPHGEPPAPEHAGGEHGSHGHHVPTWDDINWFTGMIGEKEGVEPDFFWRKKGDPPPLGALLINTAIVYYLIYRFGKKPIKDGLVRRKANLLRGIEEASALRAEARRRLDEYEEKLANIDKEIERLRREMREAGEAERARILAEARAKGERLEREARVTVELELKQARDELMAATVRRAVGEARRVMAAEMLPTDQLRLLNDYLGSMSEASGGMS
jgi:F-type H+-transporting ATPase subunit b